jgi:hypothetical protein
MRRSSILVALALVLMVVACQREQPATDTATATTTATGTTPSTASAEQQVIRYTPINPGVYVPLATINGWINATPPDDAAIADHAWDVWQAMNADSGQSYNGTTLPVWETWYDSSVVYKVDEGPAVAAATDTAQGGDVVMAKKPKRPVSSQRRFHRPNQFFKGHTAPMSTARASAAPPTGDAGLLLTFNRFTQEMKDHVWTNNYWSKQTLTTLNNGWPASTPIAQRTIKPFPNTSIMTKPVFWIVSGTQPTMVPYWNGLGSNASTNTANPANPTWKQCVLADPTGQAKNDQDRICNAGQPGQTTMKAGTYQVVPVNVVPAQSAFYAFKLSQQEVDDLKQFADELGNSNVSASQVTAGDFALLVAMHVSTREIDNWTWQTFWWQPNVSQLAADPPTAMAPPSTIPKPWNQYAGCTAYYMVTPAGAPNGQPRLCYNPYLETDLTGLDNKDQSVQNGTGVQSNCMTCHRAAAWPTNQYAIAFELDPGNPIWFSGNTKVDFAWSMQTFAH